MHRLLPQKTERNVVVYHVRADTSSVSYDEVHINNKYIYFFFFFLESFRGQSDTASIFLTFRWTQILLRKLDRQILTLTPH